MIVKKAVKMAEMMKIPVLGVVENYSYVVCPDCGKKISIFGESQIDQVAAEYQLPVLGKIPVHPEYAQAADEGTFHRIKMEELKSILG